MEVREIDLSLLRAHPDNANVMDQKQLAKLKGHIEKHNQYEPLVVRADPAEQGCYQLLNGHHRKMVLEQLGYEKAGCLVWSVSDDEALVLLATLNRLSGKDDPGKRGALLLRLSERYSAKELAGKLPETREQLKKMLAVNKVPQPVLPSEVGVIREAMTFFVEKQQKVAINQALRLVARESIGDCGGEPLGRSDCLAVMADMVLKGKVGGYGVEQEAEGGS